MATERPIFAIGVNMPIYAIAARHAESQLRAIAKDEAKYAKAKRLALCTVHDIDEWLVCADEQLDAAIVKYGA